MPDGDFRDRCTIALDHLRVLRAHLGNDLERARLFEFGAGWDLIVPQVFFAAGVRHQQLFDLNRLLQPDLMRDANRRLRDCAQLVSVTNPSLAVDMATLPDLAAVEQEAALRRLGIKYVAPADAANTGLASASVDAATNSLVLEHVPPSVIAAIFSELHRIVRPGGVVSSSVDMSDHYSHGDPTVSPWNFLRYPERTWHAMNPPILYQNRLRASEHLALISGAGFRIVDSQRRFVGTPDSFAVARKQAVPPYSSWDDVEDLRATQLHVVAIRD
ncbi:MAG TPA: class I SAM-dependent methyltransferase [Gemmatimonas sp.]|nr:class I SAM-dependent methyltransferase [Gemmatimonas sp.]